jgi:hypothetical protein
LVAHFQRCNGAQLFVASVTCRGLHLLGCREKGKPLSRDSDEPSPTDIRQTANANRDSVVFGSYGFDGSMLMVDRRSQAVRCSYGRDLSKTRREWASIDDCLESEVQRVSQLFAPDGTCLVSCEELVPTARVEIGTHKAQARESTMGLTSDDTIVPKAYCDLRGTNEWDTVPIEIYSCSDVSNRQVGYRIDPDGKSLIGRDGWKVEWIVIGHDTLVGDPIFIDVRRMGFPVFTAAHGEGAWEPFMIASSAAVLFRTLDTLAAVRERRLDRETATTKLAALNGDADVDLEFWTVLIEDVEN